MNQALIKGQPRLRLSSDTPWYGDAVMTANSFSLGNPAVQYVAHAFVHDEQIGSVALRPAFTDGLPLSREQG